MHRLPGVLDSGKINFLCTEFKIGSRPIKRIEKEFSSNVILENDALAGLWNKFTAPVKFNIVALLTNQCRYRRCKLLIKY
jgi:hypothetical protein